MSFSFSYWNITALMPVCDLGTWMSKILPSCLYRVWLDNRHQINS